MVSNLPKKLTNIQSSLLGSEPENLIEVNGTIYFTADNGKEGRELWKLDESGKSQLVADIYDGTGSSNPSNLTNVDGTLYFIADDEKYGRELWRINAFGRPELIKETRFWSRSSEPSNLTVLKDTLYFTQVDENNYLGLWKSKNDGTAERVKLFAFPIESISNPTVLDDSLYFTTTDVNGQSRLWLTRYGERTMSSSSKGSFPRDYNISNSITVGQDIYFILTDKNGYTQLWKVNNTQRMERVDGISAQNSFNPSNFTIVNDTLYFTTNDRNNETGLWRVNNQTGRVEIVRGLYPGLEQFSNFTISENNLYFTTVDSNNRVGLWKTSDSGNLEQIDIRINPFEAKISQLTVVDNTLYFVTTPSNGRPQLWKTSGDNLAEQVRGLPNFYSQISNLTVVENKLYFVSDRYQLWEVDGEARRVNGNYGQSSANITDLTVVNNQLHFVVKEIKQKTKIWQVNSDNDNTTNPQSYAEIVPGTNGMSDVSDLVVIQDKLYFNASKNTANKNTGGKELWNIDENNNAIPVSSENKITRKAPSNLINVNGTLYFTATNEQGTKLWKMDENEQPVPIRYNRPVKAISDPDNFTVLGDNLYFTAHGTIPESVLWKVSKDGIAREVNSIRRDILPLNPEKFTVYGDFIYFVAGEDDNRELWVINSNGDAQNLEINRNGNSDPDNFIIFDNRLLFTANDGRNGTELWFVGEGGYIPQPSRDFYLGGSSNPSNFTVINDKLYFSVTNNGREELWSLDSDEELNRISNDFRNDFQLSNFTVFQDTLYFSANNRDDFSSELWFVDENQIPKKISVERENISDLRVVGDQLYITKDRFGITYLSRIEANGRKSLFRTLSNLNQNHNLIFTENRLYYTVEDKGNTILGEITKERGFRLIRSFKNSEANLDNITTVGDSLYFTTNNTGIWGVDNSGKLSQLKEFSTEKISDINFIDGQLYLSTIDSSTQELWTRDSTGKFVPLPVNIPVGVSDPELTSINGDLYFVGSQSDNNPQIWKLENRNPELILSPSTEKLREISYFSDRLFKPVKDAIIKDDSFYFEKAQLTVEVIGGGNPDDRLDIESEKHPGSVKNGITLDGRIIKFNDVKIGTFTPDYDNQKITVYFGENATSESVEKLIERITFNNYSRNLSQEQKTLEFTLTDGNGGISESVTQTFNIQGRQNETSFVDNLSLYNPNFGISGFLATNTQYYAHLGYQSNAENRHIKNDNHSFDNRIITLKTDNKLEAGYSNHLVDFSTGFITNRLLNPNFPELNTQEGYVLTFQVQVVSEDHTSSGNTDKNGDGKADRAGFNVLALGSDRLGIEVSFWENRIWVKEDASSQENTSLKASAENPYHTLFTQAEGVDFDTTKLVNYDLAIFNGGYTLYADNQSILTGKLRNYATFKPERPKYGIAHTPYDNRNLIFLGDNTPFASAEINLAKVEIKTKTQSPTTQIALDRDSRNGTIVTQLYAIDPDTNYQNLKWKILGGNLDLDGDGSQPFKIDPQKGIITLNDRDDIRYKSNQSLFSLKVEAEEISNGLRTSSKQHIVDISIDKIEPILIEGTAGNDKLTGNSKVNLIYGFNGNDILQGNKGDDELHGGKGYDKLTGGQGNDKLDGGEGSDRVIEIFDTDFTLTNTQLQGNGIDTLTNIESAQLTAGDSDNVLDASEFTLGGVRLSGLDGDDTLKGTNNRDYLNGGDGNDNIFGNAGNDTIIGSLGNDYIDGGDGRDQLRERGDVNFTLKDGQLTGLGNDQLVSIETVKLYGGVSDNTIDASGFTQGRVYIYGYAGNDNLTGGSDRDYLFGGDDDDIINGGAGNDLIRGDAGNDTISGGEGRDKIFGRGGADIFVLTPGEDTDTIYDFKDGEDKLRLGGGISFNDLTISDSNKGSNIILGNEILATLRKVQSTQIDISDFQFV